jgi:hypothetical protein
MPPIQVQCPECDSEDIDGRPGSGDAIELTCARCRHTWEREPSHGCPRCGSSDVIDTPWESWEWDDWEAGTRSRIEGSAYRCNKCLNTWEEVGTEPIDDVLTKDDLAAETVVELRERALDLGLDTAGMKKAALIAAILRDWEQDYYSEDQLNRMPKQALDQVARDFDIAAGGHSVPFLVAAILDRQQQEAAATAD